MTFFVQVDPRALVHQVFYSITVVPAQAWNAQLMKTALSIKLVLVIDAEIHAQVLVELEHLVELKNITQFVRVIMA